MHINVDHRGLVLYYTIHFVPLEHNICDVTISSMCLCVRIRVYVSMVATSNTRVLTILRWTRARICVRFIFIACCFILSLHVSISTHTQSLCVIFIFFFNILFSLLLWFRLKALLSISFSSIYVYCEQALRWCRCTMGTGVHTVASTFCTAFHAYICDAMMMMMAWVGVIQLQTVNI